MKSCLLLLIIAIFTYAQAQTVEKVGINATADTLIEGAAHAYYYRTSAGTFSYIIANGWYATHNGELPPNEVGQNKFCSSLMAHTLITPKGQIIEGWPVSRAVNGKYFLLPINKFWEENGEVFFSTAYRGHQTWHYISASDSLELLDYKYEF